MDNREPTLVPEWYKASSSNNTNSNNHSGSSSHPNEHVSWLYSRKRLPPCSRDCDSSRSLSFTDRSSSSFRRSTSSNGSLTNYKDSLHSQPYSSFGRRHRDRDRDRSRSREHDCDHDRDWDRDRSLFFDNGFHDSFESSACSRNEKDALRRSHSMISAKRGDSWSKKLGAESSNGNHSGGTSVSGVSKVSFERDLPSFGTDVKQGAIEIVRVSSPVLNATSLPIGAYVKPGANGWTSALVVPGTAGNSAPAISTSALNTALNGQSNASSTSTGLNMAETLAQAPLKVRTEPQLADDILKKEEFARRQCAKLVPLTPSTPKTSASEKSKAKAAIVTSKIGQQSSQNSVRAPTKPDTSKLSSAGTMQVLNRDKNTLAPTVSTTSAVSRAVNQVGIVAAAVNGPSMNAVNSKLNDHSKGGLLQSNMELHEKRLQSQVQNRNAFFNSLRMKSSLNNTETSTTPLNEIVTVRVSFGNGMINGNGENGGLDVCEVPKSSVPHDEQSPRSNPSINPDEEAALLQSLGWEENEVYEPLTQEEIFSFAEKCKKFVPPPTAQDRICRALRMLNVSDEVLEPDFV